MLVVKYACNENPWGTGVLKYILKVQGYKKIWIDRKGRSRTLKKHNWYFMRLITPFMHLTTLWAFPSHGKCNSGLIVRKLNEFIIPKPEWQKVVWIGRKYGLWAGISEMFYITNEENVDCHRDMTMTSIMRLSAETQLYFTGVVETPYVCLWVAEMPSVCTGVAETSPDFNRVAGTPWLVQKKLSCLRNTSEKDTFEVVCSLLAGPTYTTSGK